MINKFDNRKIKVTFNDNKEILVKYKTTVEQALKQVKNEEELQDILSVELNNEIKTFETELVDNSKITPIKYTSIEGHRIYSRTVKFILWMALKRVYPNLEIEFSNNINNSSYFICKNNEFTPVMVAEVLKEMRQIVKNNSKIERKVVNYDEARVLFKLNKDNKKLLNTEVKMSSYITLYFCEDMFNTMYGALAPNTSLIEEFDIKIFRKGFLLIYPNNDNINIINKKVENNKLYDILEEYNKYSDFTRVKSIADLNREIINNRTEDIIKMSETIHNNKISSIIQDIEKRNDLKMILIAGPSSSGKTTLAGKLVTSLKLIGYNPVVISMDDYYKNMEERYIKETNCYDTESVYALDIKLFNNHIKNLLAGKKVKIPTYNFVTGQREEKNKFLQLEKQDLLIIEGIHALNPLISSSVSDIQKYKIYIAPITTLNIDDYSKFSATDTRILRRIVRDYNTRGYSVENVFSMWAEVMKGEKEYIFPFVNTADYIFNTSLIYEISALKLYADPLLLQINKDNEYFFEARRLYELLKKFIPMQTKYIPANSILREFIGKPN